MKMEQWAWTADTRWQALVSEEKINPQIVFIFGDNQSVRNTDALGFVRSRYPQARIFGGTSAYEINQKGFCTNSIVVTAVEFRDVALQFVRAPLTELTSREAARNLVDQLSDKHEIGHLVVLSEGLDVNGGQIVNALAEALPGVSISGGMAADKDITLPNYLILDSEMSEKCIIGVAFGKTLKVGCGLHGGWDSFGVDRKITRSDGRCVYEVDGQPALSLYKKYLGDEARNLPHSGHYFPVSLKQHLGQEGVVRSVVQIDEAEDALIFTSDMPQGWYFRLMKTNYDRLALAAATAAEKSIAGMSMGKKFLALIVSCVGRQVVLKHRVDEEVEEASRVLGKNAVMCGFYSLGEICPVPTGASGAQYHNQTMTITILTDDE